MRRLLIVVFLLGSLQSFAQAPALFFTDLESGPNSGGQNVSGYAGVFVTLYGNNFGATQGSSTITLNGSSCLRVVDWGSSYLWYQKIVVQLGSTCATGNFSVTTAAGSSNVLPFTVRAGNIYFVATTGNDTSGNGSYAAPWKTMQKALNTMPAGATTYVLGGVAQTGGSGSDGISLAWSAFGTAGSPVALVAYPGATPQPLVGNNNVGYGIRCNAPYSADTCSYSVIAGIKTLSNGRAIKFEYGGDHNRFIANDISCPSGDGQTGCFANNDVNYSWFYGNYIHDNASVSGNSSKQYHSVYFSTDVNHVWVGWNKWYNNYTCRALQFHSSPYDNCPSPTGKQQFDLHVHDNWFDGDRCNAINLATIDPSKGAVEVYNNLIMNVGRGPTSTDGESVAYAGIYMPDITNCSGAANPPGTGTVDVYNNTLYNVGGFQAFGFYGGAYNNSAASMTMRLTNNIAAFSSASYSYFGQNNAAVRVTGTNNLWYGVGSGPAGTSNNLNANPLFVDAANGNLRLQETSPAKESGSAGVASAYDLNGLLRPNPPSRGAYEYSAGSSIGHTTLSGVTAFGIIVK